MASTLTWGYIVQLCQSKFVDEGNHDKSDADWLGLAGMTLRKIVQLAPQAYTNTDVIRLVSGVEQSVDGLALVSAVKNMGTDGETEGAAITTVDIGVMIANVPSWNTATASATVEHVIPIPGNKSSFFCYPPQPSSNTGYIQVIQSETPPIPSYDADDEWEGMTISLDDDYAAAIVNGMMYHAYDDDTDIPGNMSRAGMYMRRLYMDLGIQGVK